MDPEVTLPSGRLLSTLKVKDLQKELSKRRLSCAGKKADLLARLTEHIIIYESGRNSTGDQVSVSPATTEEQILPEVLIRSKEVSERQQTKKKTKKRRSHSRLNETFEYVEDDEDTTQAFTPEVKCVASLVDATHRKSSRQAKDRRSRGDSGVGVTHEVVRAQTPRSSRKAKRSSTVDRAGSLTDDEAEQKSEAVPSPEFLTDDEGDKKRDDPTFDSRHISAKNDASPKENIKQDGEAMTPSRTNSTKREHSEKSITSESRTITMRTSTPQSVGRSRNGFAAPTVSSTARSTSRKREALFPNDVTKTINEKSNANTPRHCLPSTSRPIQKKEKGNATAQFARQHALLFAEMESILDQQKRIARKHEENMKAVPDVAKRLATPKAIRNPLRDANSSVGKESGYVFDASKAKTSVRETSFTFGKVEDFRHEQNQDASGTVTTSFSLRASKTRDQRDVKSRTKTSGNQRKKTGFLGLTMPVNNSSLNRLATPKGMAPAQARQKVAYTPRRGAVGAFVDTTKLSDREYELAVANGLIKARSRASAKVETSRRSRRDDILDVRRKLNI
ncbi:hypothetical protein RB195_009527 [Necator americanus]|uniref:SAP domain-containing protein n=1 Tax=Necator americanus TaxID=51031 RepID=A0ABR1CTQ9_NECAM